VYLLDQSTGQVFTNPSATTTSWTPSLALTPGHSYLWYVAAISSNNQAGTWSSASTFTLAALSAPVQSGPAGNIASITPDFQWSAVAGADHYYLWLADVSTNQWPVLLDAAIQGTSWTASQSLQTGHTYQWYVAAVSTNGRALAWSPAKAFTVSI
jgi:hypothetical protein